MSGTTFQTDGLLDTFTIATTGTYEITAIGAAGGGEIGVSQNGTLSTGGAGAEVSADFALSQGDVIEVLVGGAGSTGGLAGGGGGGTFVYDETTGQLLEAAGGGGGAGATSDGGNALAGTAGQDGSNSGGSGGDAGSGGSGSLGGGGGGFLSAGSDGAGYDGSANGVLYSPGYSAGATMVSQAGGEGGSGFTTLVVAGVGSSDGGTGGFGGGGGGGTNGAVSAGSGGGGGGGYSGGGGGGYTGGTDPHAVNGGGGGGGGSYVAATATNIVLTTGANPSGNGSADLTLEALCFRAGTRLATQRGPVPVEHLAIGDLVPTQFGGMTAVQWIGRRHIDCRRYPKPEKVWPVRVRAHAFGAGMPQRDLWLSPNHAVFVAGVLIPVKHLINGGSIEQVPVDEVIYYHVELPQHDVLWAEGLQAESYLDTGDRSNFENGGSLAAAHPDFSTSSLMWEALGCAPLVVCGPAVAAARRMLAGRARELGYAATERAAAA